MTKAYTHENDTDIANLYLGGTSAYAIADRFGISPGTVYNALKRRGVTRRPGGPVSRWQDTEENRLELVAEYKAGQSVRSLARARHINNTVVMMVLDESGLGWRHPGGKRRFTDEQSAEFAGFYLAGESLHQVAARYETNYVTIREYLVRAGIPLRPVGVPAFWTGARKAEAIRRYQAGEQIKDIAKAIRCGPDALAKRLRECGLIPDRRGLRGAEHPSWRGGRYVDDGGYVRVLVTDADRHLADETKTGYVLEHRLVMARAIGRRLHRDETVHHKRGKDENKLEHLELWTGSHPKGQRVDDVVEWAAEMLQRYAPDRLKYALDGE